MAPKSAKGHSDAGSIFDIKKPDLSPVEKKLAAEDEGSLVEALAMLHAVPHTDGFKARFPSCSGMTHSLFQSRW